MPAKFLREAGFYPGIFDPGPLNCIADVQGLLVGQKTLIEGTAVRTGVTAILPHAGDLYQDRVPAGLAVGNGFGKMSGVTQIQELGELETPILLTNTLAVPRAMEAIINWTLHRSMEEDLRSINAVVGETNDGYLNDIRSLSVSVDHCLAAIDSAEEGQAIVEGNVGAGTGTVCFGWKGGVGSSSRQLSPALGGYTVGVLVQTNFGGDLQILGVPVGRMLQNRPNLNDGQGSIMIILATDAPLSDRNLKRLAWRALGGLARTGSNLANGSGDYALAFSTAESARRTRQRRQRAWLVESLSNDLMSPLFQMAIEASEEAIYNAIFAAQSMAGYRGRRVEALPKEKVLALLREFSVLAEKEKRE